jgi:hypothetical protein
MRLGGLSFAAADKPDLVRLEMARLEALGARIRSRDTTEPDKMQRRFDALESMRGRTTRSCAN